MTDSAWVAGGQPMSTAPGATVAARGPVVPVSSDPNYPVVAGLSGPEEFGRLQVIVHYFKSIPHMIMLAVLMSVANLFVFLAWFAVMFTGRMPEGLGTFIAGVHRYQWRVVTYYLVLRDEYPAFNVPSGYAEPGGDPAWLQIAPPQQYSRASVFFRGFLAIPHFFYGAVLSIAWMFAAGIGLLAVLFTGKWPAGMRRFVIGFEFWAIRFNAWYSLLADPYPPFTTN